jgi:hypothetical protein
MSHTKGRLIAEVLRITINGVQGKYHCVGIGGAKKVVAITGEEKPGAGEVSHADARRLATCWNALMPFTTEQIEKLEIDVAKVVQERDELLAALERLEQLSGQAMMSDDPARAEARAILAKYKEAE